MDVVEAPDKTKRTAMSADEKMRRGYEMRWKKDNYGNWKPPELVDRFLEEVCLQPPLTRPTQADWAEANGVAERTVSMWKRDQRFLDEWTRRMSLTWAHPSNVGRIIDNLIEQASSPEGNSTKAAELYLKFVGMMAPPELQLKIKTVADDLSKVATPELIELARQDLAVEEFNPYALDA